MDLSSYTSKSRASRTYVKLADPLETKKVHKVTEPENPNTGFATDLKRTKSLDSSE
jgi:hypothetical protein